MPRPLMMAIGIGARNGDGDGDGEGDADEPKVNSGTSSMRAVSESHLARFDDVSSATAGDGAACERLAR